MTEGELDEVLALACELRQRVRQQLHLIAPGEYDRVQLGVRILPSGREIAVVLPEGECVQWVTLTEKPSVGEVMGLAVAGDHGKLLRFETQVTRGNGRFIAWVEPARDEGDHRGRGALFPRHSEGPRHWQGLALAPRT